MKKLVNKIRVIELEIEALAPFAAFEIDVKVLKVKRERLVRKLLIKIEKKNAKRNYF